MNRLLKLGDALYFYSFNFFFTMILAIHAVKNQDRCTRRPAPCQRRTHSWDSDFATDVLQDAREQLGKSVR